MNEPASVTAERARLDAAWWEGADAGYHSVEPLPAWWFDTPPARMTKRQRGYFFGKELRDSEKEPHV